MLKKQESLKLKLKKLIQEDRKSINENGKEKRLKRKNNKENKDK
jgi:hypothetical protein